MSAALDLAFRQYQQNRMQANRNYQVRPANELAGHRTFDIAELRVMVISNLDVRDLVRDRRVNRNWRSDIDTDPNIKKKMFITASDMVERYYDTDWENEAVTLVTDGRKTGTFENILNPTVATYEDDLQDAPWQALRRRGISVELNKEAVLAQETLLVAPRVMARPSCRSMHICMPSVNMVTVQVTRGLEPTYWEVDTIKKQGSGITVQDVYDTLEEHGLMAPGAEPSRIIARLHGCFVNSDFI